MRVPKYGCRNLASPLVSFWSLWTAFTNCYPLSWRSFCFRCIKVDLCFIHCHIPTQKILFTSLEQLQTALWIRNALFFWSGWYYPEIIWIWQQWLHLYVILETYWGICYSKEAEKWLKACLVPVDLQHLRLTNISKKWNEWYCKIKKQYYLGIMRRLS